MKILNLYAGIGGNRKLWPEGHEITAVEINPEIARIYQDFFPNDKVIVADAHQYLLEHYKEFDFIWSSPPCPSHCRPRNQAGVGRGQVEAIYPDMKLYEEIIFLDYFFDGVWVVENVISYYPPLIKPQRVMEHYLWANFIINGKTNECRGHYAGVKQLQNLKGFDLTKYRGLDKEKILRNCVNPKLGLHIFNCAFKTKQMVLEVAT